MRRRRPSLFGAFLFGLILLWQVWRLLLTPHGVASAWTMGAGVSVVSTGGAGVSQELVMGADGFDGVWVRLARGDQDVARDARLLVTLSRLDNGRPVPLERRVVELAAVRQGAWHVPFEEVRHSRGVTFVVGLQHVSSADGAPVALAARPDRPARAGRFHVDGVEQWGTLVFEATARRATLPYWKHEILAAWPAWAQSWGTIAGAWLLGNVLLAVACFRATAPRHRAPTTRPSLSASGDSGAARRTALLATILIVTGGVVVAAWPQSRFHVIHLAEHLADAGIETPAPLHEAIAVQRLGYQGRMLQSIVALPPARLAWTVQVPTGALLVGHAAMRPDVWAKESDGVNMRVCVVADGDGGATEVARFTLLPFKIGAHRAFHPFRVSLDPWAGRQVTLVFETDPERWGNAVNDVPVWVEPRVVWPRGPQWGTGGIGAAGQLAGRSGCQ